MQLNSTWAIIVTIIPAAVVILSGIMKLAGSQQVVTKLTQVGVIQYVKPLGLAEIIFSALFIYPATNLIGFVLLACYFSGAMAVDLSYKISIKPALFVLSLVFIAEFIAYGAVFF